MSELVKGDRGEWCRPGTAPGPGCYNIKSALISGRASRFVERGEVYVPDNSGASSFIPCSTPSSELGIQLREQRFHARNREWSSYNELGPGEYDPA